MNSIFRTPLTAAQKAVWRAGIAAPSARYVADLKAEPDPAGKQLRKADFKAELAAIRARILAHVPEGEDTRTSGRPSLRINTVIAAANAPLAIKEPDDQCGLCHWWGWPSGEPCCCANAEHPE